MIAKKTAISQYSSYGIHYYPGCDKKRILGLIVMAVLTITGCVNKSECISIKKLRNDMIKIPGKDFVVLKYTVTQGLYEQVMNYTSSSHVLDTSSSPSSSSSGPVTNVSWYDAIEFCNRLSELCGYKKVYLINDNEVVINEKANGYRLPTSDEWFQCTKSKADLIYNDDIWEWCEEDFPFGSHEPYKCYCRYSAPETSELDSKSGSRKWILNTADHKADNLGFRIIRKK